MNPELLVYGPETREESIARVVSGAGRIALGEQVKLHLKEIETRSFQIDTWQTLEDARKAGKDSALIHLATGLGKTTVAVIDALRFIKESMESGEENTRVPRILFACHQKEILDQASERFFEFAPALTQGKYAGREKNLDGEVTFATFQSLRSDLDELDPSQFDYIIYDEAHHAQADTFKDVIEHLKPKFKLALTATPERMDGEKIEDLFGDAVYSKPLVEAMTEGHLAKVDYHIVFDDAVKKAMEEGFDPKTLKEIKELLNNASRNEEIALQIMEKMEEIGLRDAKTIVFCENIDQANEMASLLGGKPYHSEVLSDERQATLAQFKSNGLQVITTRDMFNEGVDIPDARLIVFLRSTSSKTIFEQQLGRGLRKDADKDMVSVLDFVANIERILMVKDLAPLKGDRIVTDRIKDDTSLDNVSDSHFIISSTAGEFDFDKIAVALIDKYVSIRERVDHSIELANLSNEDLVALAQRLSPDAILTSTVANQLSKDGQFVSFPTIQNRFGSMRRFQAEAWPGLAQEEKTFDSSAMADEELVAIVRTISSDKILTKREIEVLAKDGEFASDYEVKKRFGSIRKFQAEAWPDLVQDRKSFDTRSKTDEDLVAVARGISPDRMLTKKEIEQLYKDGEFASFDTVHKRFGSMREFQAEAWPELAQDEKIFDSSDMTNEDLVALARTISPDKILTRKEIMELNKGGEFINDYEIKKRFGSYGEFQAEAWPKHIV